MCAVTTDPIRIEKRKREREGKRRKTNDIRASAKRNTKKHTHSLTHSQPASECVSASERASETCKKEHNLWSMVLLFSPSEIYKLKEFHIAFFDCVLGIFFTSSFELKCGQQVETAVAPATTTVVDVAAV